MFNVQSVNVAERLALLDDGRTGTITHLFNEDGGDTDDPAAAVAAVVRVAEDEWYSIDLREYEPASLN